MTTLVDGYRSVLLDGDWPAALPLAAVALGSALVALAGWKLFQRLEPSFVDEL
jgi:ABC-type polysaccharide/polyol phosphate export permease